MKRLISLVTLLVLSGCAITVQPTKEELRFFHDESRGDVKFICWRTNQIGWQCKRTDLNGWSSAKKVLKLEGSAEDR